MQFNDHTFSFVPRSSSISLFKTISGKGLSKNATSGRNRNLNYVSSFVGSSCPSPAFFNPLMQWQNLLCDSCPFPWQRDMSVLQFLILDSCYPKKEKLYTVPDAEEQFGIWSTLVWLHGTRNILGFYYSGPVNSYFSILSPLT